MSQKLAIPLARFKRWSREFLPPDNLGGYQSGYARQYNLNDAFAVYLGGFLVHDAKLSVPQARAVLQSLGKYLPNLYSEVKTASLRELQLAIVLDHHNNALCKMQSGPRAVFADETFAEHVDDFVRLVMLGRIILRFIDRLNA